MAGPGDDNTVLIYRGRTNLGTLVPDIVLEEVHEDRLQITEHPVESGMQVADHAYLRPKTVEMRIGWADYKAGAVGSANAKYQFMLVVQARRQPVTMSTGKRLYKNMLPESITLVNDNRSKFAALPILRWREVRISASQMINTQTQSAPQTTAPPVNRGTVSPREITKNDVPNILVQPPDASANILPEIPLI